MHVRFPLLLLIPLAAPAQTFHGRVMNGSTGNPVPSSQVTLFTSAGEQGRVLTNDTGEFRISLHSKQDRRSAAILQVTKDGVDYFRPAIQGEFAKVTVYQSAKSVNLISSPLTLLQFQTSGDKLQITELHALNNVSDPPITQVDPDNFVVFIPRGAHTEPVIISSPDGGTSTVPLVPASDSGAKQLIGYRVDFPIKPGLTKYAIRYDVPYENSTFVFARRTQYPLDRFGVLIPGSMRFRSTSPALFHQLASSEKLQEQQFEVDKLCANVPIAFTLSGTGLLAHSFRPLQPAESAVSAHSLTKTASPPPPIALHSAAQHLNHPHFRYVGYARILIVSIFALFGVLAWFSWQKNRLTNRESPARSTDVGLSYRPAQPAPREVPNMRR